MKKLKIAAPLIALLLVLTGCRTLLTEINNYLYADTYDSVKYVSEYRNNWQYQQLGTEFQDYYGSMYTAVMDTANVASQLDFTNENGETESIAGVRIRFLDCRMKDTDTELLFEAFFRDNPQFFYVDREYRIEGQKGRDGVTYYDTIILQYLMPSELRAAAIRTFDAAIDDMLDGVPDGDDQYETQLSLYDRLAKHCTYDTVAAENMDDDSDPMAYTAYGAVVDGSAVCEGYAKAMQLLLNRCGIPATTVRGDAIDSDVSHMWNLVTVNGNHYYFDPTWSDNGDKGTHAYFNITTEVLNRTHKIDEKNLGLPNCTATEDNYFVRNGTYIDFYERKKIAGVIADKILDGDTCIQLQFSPKTFDNGLLFVRNVDLIFDMVDEHLEPHGKSLWDFALTTDKESYILTIEKS